MTGFNSVAYLGVDARTKYDASCMRRQLIQRDYGTGDVAVLWEQDQSGAYWHFQYMAYDAATAGLAFRVVAVPNRLRSPTPPPAPSLKGAGGILLSTMMNCSDGAVNLDIRLGCLLI